MGDISAEFISLAVKQGNEERAFEFHPVTGGSGKWPVMRHRVGGIIMADIVRALQVNN